VSSTAAVRPSNRTRRKPGRATAADLAVEYIKQEIWDGRLRPGQRVPQPDVALALGMSGTPVRQAVSILAQQGRVIIENHRGSFIAPFDRQFVLEHYELIGVVYGWSATRCANRRDPAILEQLEPLADRIVSALTPDELFEQASAAFFFIHSESGSWASMHLVQSLAGLVPGNVYSVVPATIAVTRRSIPAIIAAVREGNGERAGILCQTMWHEHGQLIVDHLVGIGTFE